MTGEINGSINIDTATPVLDKDFIYDIYFAEIVITFIMIIVVFFKKITPSKYANIFRLW